jgi:hypothetical protein
MVGNLSKLEYGDVVTGLSRVFLPAPGTEAGREEGN